MKRYITALLVLLASVSASATEEGVLKPQAWNEMNEVIVQGDIPEIQGIATAPVLFTPEQPSTSVDTAALAVWAGGEGWSNLLLGGIVATIALFTLFTMINGSVKLDKGFSGVKIFRWSKADIIFHWVGALSCLGLLVTGIAIASGRFLFADMMGSHNWGNFIQSMVSSHNWMAFPFILGWAVMVLKWGSKQFPEKGDMAWFRALGGYINNGKGKHPDAGFANAGEKLWFWAFTLFGGVLVFSGLAMMFPVLSGFDKGAMNWMLVLHMVGAGIVGVFAVVHIFMATLISEGGMEAMVTGYCDENWAKQHHNLWHKSLR